MSPGWAKAALACVFKCPLRRHLVKGVQTIDRMPENGLAIVTQ
ncbi:hypothetical protein RRSWK_00909 [Rhodopirellula sp. SWK7]|nr:hypothetical protein RRSWK_00909 [Rhodopirellula sp. SWK7]